MIALASGDIRIQYKFKYPTEFYNLVINIKVEENKISKTCI